MGWVFGRRERSGERLAMSAKSRGVVERSLSSFVDALQHTFDAEELAKKKGLLQRLDPRVKIVAILPLILIAALARQLPVIVALFALAVALALLSKVPLGTLAKRVWLGCAHFHRTHFSSSSFPDSRPRDLQPACFWTGRSRRRDYAPQSTWSCGPRRPRRFPFWSFFARPGATC